MPERIVIPFLRPRYEIASHVRSSLLLSSIQSLKQHSLYDRYVAQLDAQNRETLLSMVAGVWLPMDVGMSHYIACEALGLSVAEQVQIGREVNDRIQGSLMGVLVKTAKNVGATPWTPLESSARLWERTFQGGAGVCVTEVGPKEARVELVGLPILDILYFRHAYRGAFLGALELFAQKVYVSEIRSAAASGEVRFRISWV